MMLLTKNGSPKEITCRAQAVACDLSHFGPEGCANPANQLSLRLEY
jgi:hypothetical protein